MQVPEALAERLSFLGPLENDWDSVPRLALAAWLVFYAVVLYGAARGSGLPVLIDLVFVPVHEGGHLLFRFFGEFLYIAGGTFLQLFVPAALAVYFVFRRQAQGTAFCAFFFFQQFLPISVYMADARAQDLPLLTVGDADYVIHDWNYLFGRLGLLAHDTQIAAFVRTIGWLGMLATVAWLIGRGLARHSRAGVNASI